MKKIAFIALGFCLLTGNTFAQEKVEKSIKKEVKMEDENGQKTLTITTTENGVVTEEVFTGEEADAKMEELLAAENRTEEVKKEVRVEEVDGERKVTITTTANGRIKEEVYTGEDAEKKIRELEAGEEDQEMSLEKALMKKEVVIEKEEE